MSQSFKIIIVTAILLVILSSTANALDSKVAEFGVYTNPQIVSAGNAFNVQVDLNHSVAGITYIYILKRIGIGNYTKIAGWQSFINSESITTGPFIIPVATDVSTCFIEVKVANTQNYILYDKFFGPINALDPPTPHSLNVWPNP
jgi:hypothetical protein